MPSCLMAITDRHTSELPYTANVGWVHIILQLQVSVYCLWGKILLKGVSKMAIELTFNPYKEKLFKNFTLKDVAFIERRA